nr:MAG TPA_asm: hypothetical protein [Bacteriophage sp.]
MYSNLLFLFRLLFGVEVLSTVLEVRPIENPLI